MKSVTVSTHAVNTRITLSRSGIYSLEFSQSNSVLLLNRNYLHTVSSVCIDLKKLHILYTVTKL